MTGGCQCGAIRYAIASFLLLLTVRAMFILLSPPRQFDLYCSRKFQRAGTV